MLSRALLGDSWLAESDEPLTDLQITLYITISICLILMAGLMSGLTLGLMSLDQIELEVLKRSGTPEEKRCAAIIMPVIKNQHFLLVTLLLCNAASTEALPLFIDRLADPVTAVVVSVSSVLVFGEIIPQAICSRYGLKVGAYSAWFVRGLMWLCSPLAWPIGKLLDFLLGSEHSALFRRAQLKALVDVHSTSAGFGGTLSEQEIAVIRGALDLTAKTAAKSMTPLDKVFMLSSEDRLDERTMQAILLSGHSRIPVYREGNRRDILGLILSKELVLIDPADNLTVSQLKIRQLPRLSVDTPMYDMLKLFETGKSHMALLTLAAPAGGPQQQASTGGMDANRVATKLSMGKHGTLDQSIKRLNSGASFHSRNGGYGREDDTGSAYDGAHAHLGCYIEGVEGEPVGIITIEDVIEELLQEEIIDETDLFVDNLQATRVNAAEVTGGLPPRLQRMLNAGMFTPRVGRLGANQRFMMPPGMTDDVSAHRHVHLSSEQDPAQVVDGPLYKAGAGPGHISIPLVSVSPSAGSEYVPAFPGGPQPQAAEDPGKLSHRVSSESGSQKGHPTGNAGPRLPWLPGRRSPPGEREPGPKGDDAAEPLLGGGKQTKSSSGR